MELLAPAGTMENFIAGLEAGADAIYLGGKGFNARAHAANFDIDELAEAIRLAHILDVSVYVTVNILIGDREMKDLTSYLKDLKRIGVDAIIVQDLAVAKLAQQVAPNLHLHGSTQMTATTLDAVRFYEKLGFTRVVLGRELSLDEIRHICKNCKVEIEIFVHGALCVCYSGQCLMSSFIGGRSGNRGACAQPCRLPYELIDESGKNVLPPNENYVLSPKDLNYSAFMNELVEAGVASFKVEGRMKKVSYVRQVIGTYRDILNRAKGHEHEPTKLTKHDTLALESGFNRGFSTSYLEHQVGRQMITAVAPNNQGKPVGKAVHKKGKLELLLQETVEHGSLLKVIQKAGSVVYYEFDSSWKQIKEGHYVGTPEEGMADGTVYVASAPKQQKSRGLQEFTRKYPVYAYLQMENPGVSLTLLLENGMTVTVDHEYVPKIADHNPTSIEKVQDQLSRLGNTLFALSGVNMPEGPYLWPASVLNDLRRRGVEALEAELIEYHRTEWAKRSVEPSDYSELQAKSQLEVKSQLQTKSQLEVQNSNLSLPAISARVDELDGVRAAIAGGAHKIVFGGDRLQRTPYQADVYAQVVELCRKGQVYCTFTIPRVIKDDEVETYLTTLQAMIGAKPDAIGIHVPQALIWLNDLGFTGHIECDTGLNIFNTHSAQFWEGLQVSAIAPSQEMTLTQISELTRHIHTPIETMVHGRTEMMISEYCAIASFVGTGQKENCPAPCLKQHYALKDRKGELFLLRTDPYCRMHIMNSHEMDMKAYVPELVQKGISILRIDGRQVGSKQLERTVRDYVDILEQRKPAPPKQQDAMEAPITRGHYFRGIL